MNKQVFVGTKPLLLLALRRDRLKLTVWLLGITALVASLAQSYAEFSAAEMKSMVSVASQNPGMRLLVAPISPESVSELGAFLLFRGSFLIAIFVALMSIGAVLRHTRHNEETGCAELLGSMVTGRFAILAAALLVAVSANVVLSLLITVVLTGSGLPFAGSLAAGLSMGALGIVFSGIAAITAQLSETTRGSNGLSLLALAVSFVFNALGNVLGSVNPDGLGYTSGWMVWLSPLGWTQQVMAFDQNNWWPLLLFFVAFPFMAYVAFELVTRRDLGRGIMASRLGPASAAPSLLSPLGLAWRLQRGTIIGWAIPVLIIGLLFGAASQAFGDAISDIELFERLSASASQFRFMLINVMALAVSLFTMQTILRMRSEEDGGPLEAILATKVSRTHWMASHMTCSFLGTLVLLALFGTGLSLSSGATGEEATRFIAGSLLQTIPILTIGGLVVAIYGLFPRISRAVSGAVVLLGIMTGPFFGPLMGLPESVRKISPFTHVPAVPSDVSVATAAKLSVLAALLITIGLKAFNQRDLSL